MGGYRLELILDFQFREGARPCQKFIMERLVFKLSILLAWLITSTCLHILIC